jgi:predicted RecB family nuclease
MLINEELFAAFVDCKTKSFLKLTEPDGDRSEFLEWQRRILDDYKQKCSLRLQERCNESDDYYLGSPSLEDLKGNQYRIVINCVLQAEHLQSSFHALARLDSDPRKLKPYIPIRFVPSEKIAKRDKLLLAFDALVISIASGEMPPFGRIIHGNDQRNVRIGLSQLMKSAQAIVQDIKKQVSTQAPELRLNKHCGECEFQQQCHAIAVDRDDLSLLSRMTEKEKDQQRAKGILSVTQLSYTFRPRRRPKRSPIHGNKHNYALQALAIRERKIHVVGRPELKLAPTSVFIDVEAVPDRDFYYLVGLRITNGSTVVQHSYWANESSEEKEIWLSCLQTLAQLEDPQLIHYGSFEATYFKRMIERYGTGEQRRTGLDQVIANSVNVLSLIYGSIYFPTYSNSLKEISKYLGFTWSENSASGLHSLMWRSQWETSREARVRRKLVTYNSEDCEALERVTSTIVGLCNRSTADQQSLLPAEAVVDVDSLQREYPQRFGRIDFALPELAAINKAAYWDYQRSKVYVRSNRRLNHIVRSAARVGVKAVRYNKTVDLAPPPRCPDCKVTQFYKHGRYSKTVYDLRFGPSSIRRWIVRYRSHRYRCFQCKATFWSEQWLSISGKIGPSLLSYAMYQVIELKLPQRIFALSMNQLFGIDLSGSIVGQLKSRAARTYRPFYDAILMRLAAGHLLHADETKINMAGESGYVWVFTNLEEVAFYYTETREAEVLQTLFSTFRGVLVSDFYNAYDSVTCPQQKCLIHLIRDLNEDLRKQPFNKELSMMVREFSSLMKAIVETIDRFGLKTRFLRRHKKAVDRFFSDLANSECQSEIMIKYQKRFEKNRDKLFTFLDFDGIPWNNNNAEHAIKSFALLRNVIRGSSSPKGMREYTILLSICETCKYKGISFLDFLRSGKSLVSVI